MYIKSYWVRPREEGSKQEGSKSLAFFRFHCIQFWLFLLPQFLRGQEQFTRGLSIPLYTLYVSVSNQQLLSPLGPNRKGDRHRPMQEPTFICLRKVWLSLRFCQPWVQRANRARRSKVHTYSETFPSHWRWCGASSLNIEQSTTQFFKDHPMFLPVCKNVSNESMVKTGKSLQLQRRILRTVALYAFFF